jgi:hypothetical protein
MMRGVGEKGYDQVDVPCSGLYASLVSVAGRPLVGMACAVHAIAGRQFLSGEGLRTIHIAHPLATA